ncbi:radical SAM protein [bacterium]|nr:MAG: radical SAM protein [bacterium]
MAGVMAGTAILSCMESSGRLKTITLTINNDCNLQCPHCYLQYDNKSVVLSKSTISSIFKSDFEHLAIVGKEPLLNEKSLHILEILTNQAKKLNKKVSIITNGLGLSKVSSKLADNIDYIDISFDGGPLLYKNYRKGSFIKIIDGVNHIQNSSKVRLNALHNLNSVNINYIEDMMRIKDFGRFDSIMFSPYVDTVNDGINTVKSLPLNFIIKKLSESDSFRNNSSSVLAVDLHHTDLNHCTKEDIIKMITDLDLQGKIILIDNNPLSFGIIRVTFDDLVMSPYDSIHPSKYSYLHAKASESNLNELFTKMLAAV